MSNEKEGKDVLLSAELYGRIEGRVKTTGFGSVDEYVSHLSWRKSSRRKGRKRLRKGLGLWAISTRNSRDMETELTSIIFVAVVFIALLCQFLNVSLGVGYDTPLIPILLIMPGELTYATPIDRHKSPEYYPHASRTILYCGFPEGDRGRQ